MTKTHNNTVMYIVVLFIVDHVNRDNYNCVLPYFTDGRMVIAKINLLFHNCFSFD